MSVQLLFYCKKGVPETNQSIIDAYQGKKKKINFRRRRRANCDSCQNHTLIGTCISLWYHYHNLMIIKKCYSKQHPLLIWSSLEGNACSLRLTSLFLYLSLFILNLLYGLPTNTKRIQHSCAHNFLRTAFTSCLTAWKAACSTRLLGNSWTLSSTTKWVQRASLASTGTPPEQNWKSSLDIG